MKILFVCKHNRFRSKVAESIFKKWNRDKKIKAESAGLSLDDLRPYVADNVIQIMKNKGYEIGGIPKRITSQKINDYDVLIIVADNVDKDFFISSGFKGRIIKWEVGDCDERDKIGIKRGIEDIEKKVKDWIKKIKS